MRKVLKPGPGDAKRPDGAEGRPEKIEGWRGGVDASAATSCSLDRSAAIACLICDDIQQ